MSETNTSNTNTSDTNTSNTNTSNTNTSNTNTSNTNEIHTSKTTVHDRKIKNRSTNDRSTNKTRFARVSGLSFNDSVDLFNDIEKMYMNLKYEMDSDFPEDSQLMKLGSSSSSSSSSSGDSNNTGHTTELPNIQNLFSRDKTILDELPDLMKEFGGGETRGKKNADVVTVESIIDQVNRLGVD